MAWNGVGLPKGCAPDTRVSLARLAPMLVHHDALLSAHTEAAAYQSLNDWAIGHDDQNQESSCTGHGFDKMVTGTAKAQAILAGLPWDGVRTDIWANYALRVQDYPGLATGALLPDEGASPSTIAAGLRAFGTVARGDGPKSLNEWLDVAQLIEAQRFRISAMSSIDLSGDALSTVVLRALLRGCVEFGMQVTPSYEALSDGQVWSGPLPDERSLGGHSQAVDAARRGTNGIEFGVQGSWGDRFGRVWIPFSTFGQIAEHVYIASVVPVLRGAQ